MFRQDCYEINKLLPGFKDYGCAVCSAAHIVEQLTGKFFSPDDIYTKCKRLQHLKIIDKDFYVKDWNRLFNSFGILVDVRFEGSIYTCKEGEEEILKLVKTGFAHFVAGDGSGHYSYDSLGRRPAQKDYEIEDKRIITIRGFL